MQERILCAATWFDDGKKYPAQPLNILTGIVLCGFRHSSIFPQIGGLFRERKEAGMIKEDQGFLTSKNRYVDRFEGGQIAFAAGQIKEMNSRLYSEDLY